MSAVSAFLMKPKSNDIIEEKRFDYRLGDYIKKFEHQEGTKIVWIWMYDALYVFLKALFLSFKWKNQGEK